MTDCDVCLGMDFGDYNEVYRESTRKAGKERLCCECRGTITKGEMHHHAVLKFDGDWYSYRTCLRCHEIREVFSCGKGFLFECLWDDMDEYVFERLTTASPCFQKLSAGSKEFLLDRWRKWRFAA